MARIIGKLRDAAVVLVGLMVGSGLGLAVAFGFVSAYHVALDAQPAHAAPADPPRVASNVEECTPIGTAGTQTIYRCDDWQVGKLVYTNNYGFLFVVEE